MYFDKQRVSVYEKREGVVWRVGKASTRELHLDSEGTSRCAEGSALAQPFHRQIAGCPRVGNNADTLGNQRFTQIFSDDN